jgi:type VI secretion system protein ImpJ
VKSLVINDAALQNFRLEIDQCELLTWEGTILRFQGASMPSNAHILPRAFEEAMDPGGRPLQVYLGLKRVQPDGPNVVSMDTSAAGPTAGVKRRRYTLQESATPDLSAADGQGYALQYLQHDVQILFGDEVAPAEECELVKIGVLERTAGGRGAVLSKRYIPPCVSVQASPVLEGMLKEVRDLLTAKGRELQIYKTQRKVHTVNLGSRDTVFLLMMQTVNRYIPLLHHHLEVEETHPCTFYALLRQLIGELSTFSESVSVLGGPLPPYRHDQLWECFEPAVRLTKELLAELTKGPDYVVPLLFDGEYFSAALDKRFFEGSNRYYLSINVDMPPREVQRLLTETGKICSHEEMEALRKQAIPGLNVTYLENPPEELPRRAHCSYFVMDHHNYLWKRIEQRQNLAVYCELPPQQTEMELLVIFET